jgi:hypothetical protein
MRYLTLYLGLSLSCMSFFKTHAQPFGNFIKFDGVNDTLFRNGGNLFLSNSNYTIEFWFRICEDTFPRRQTVFSFNRNINLYMHGQYIGGDSIAYFLCSDDVNNNNAISCHTDERQGRDLDWHHIAITYERFSQNFEIYYDGHWDDLYNGYKHILSALGGTFYIGYSAYYSYIDIYKGYIDDFRISDTIRYQGDFTRPTQAFVVDAKTVALWDFNQNTITDSVYDVSGNGFHLYAGGNPVIMNVDATISQAGNTLSVIDTFDTYQWVDCANSFSEIAGDTNAYFTAISEGSYGVKITDDNCPYVSECFDITEIVTNVENEKDAALRIFPNPVTDFITIETTEPDDAQIEIFDSAGNLIYSATTNQKTTGIDISRFSSGIYFMKLKNKNENRALKISKL